MRTLIKIEFNQTINHTTKQLTNGTTYQFINPTTGELINITFYDYWVHEVHYSRIDGLPIFEIKQSQIPTDPLETFQLIYNNTNIDIKSIQIIKPIPDTTAFFTYQADNEKEIIDFILKQCNMTHKDLEDKDAYKSIIRQLKLNNIL